MKNRGDIVRDAIANSGVSQSALAKKLNVDRKTIFNYLNNPNLSLDVIVAIGKAIRYDFRKDFPELFIADTSDIVMEPSENYNKKLTECIRERRELEKKYTALLEENSALKTELLQYKKG